jgi:hypothetical protein
MRHIVGDRSVLDAGENDEEFAGSEFDGDPSFKLDAERTIPAQEQLVLVVVMPGELRTSSFDVRPLPRQASGD